MADKDPFIALKMIAYSRSQLPPREEDRTAAIFVDYARHQICKIKNLLFNDPKWELYTAEEILIEFFCLTFDENEQAREAFLAKLRGVEADDIKWLELMKTKYENDKKEEIEKISNGKPEFEDTF
jgi:hypothetical protein